MAWVSWDSLAKPKSIGGLGMKDFEIFNDALLAKSGWRLLNHPDCLLGKVLKGKYFPDTDFLLATEASSMSHGWKSVLIGRSLLKTQLGWIVGTGDNINIWMDPWLSLTKQQRPMGPPSETSAMLRVSDLFLEDSTEWDRTRIQMLLPEYEEQILCIKPSLSGAPDKQIWIGTKSGVYSVKSGYYSAIANKEDEIWLNRGFEWNKQVWNLPVAPKIKHFAWKVLKRAIPAGERLVERHINADPKCKRCGCNESIIHLLFHCPFAQQVWLLAPFANATDVRGILDLMAVWPDLVSQVCLPPTGIGAGALFPWILWMIWKARNKFVFEGFSTSPEDTLSTAIAMAREWFLNNLPESSAPRNRGRLVQVNETGAVVVRTDAAWCSSSLSSGLGWIVSSSPTDKEFSKRMEFVTSPLVAEGLALREAVITSRRLNLSNVRFESDSSGLIKNISSSIPVVELHSIVTDILNLSATFSSVSFSWISREENREADFLAKCSLNFVVPLVVVDAVNAPN
ncbi:Ribonuclease H domain-containing protein [Hirschfeldia incana]|nr:Ribonuclease H domain-containing protein [Hirschfeldia incana]